MGAFCLKRLAAEHVMGMHFQEPSVRTRFGFMAAISRLGGTAIDMPALIKKPRCPRERRWETWCVRSVATSILSSRDAPRWKPC